MFDHILLKVSDFERSKKFYKPILETLGLELSIDGESYIGFANKGKLQLMLKGGTAAETSRNVHIAFSAQSRKDVDNFHRLALMAGGVSEGAPGLRNKYHPNYYAAFVIDPDGNNIEAVCHKHV